MPIPLNVLVASLAVISISSCNEAADTKPAMLRQTATFAKLTPDGYVELADERGFRLAGVAMRSVEETGEPELLPLINELVTRESAHVEVELDEASAAAMVYYKQRIYYFDKYNPIQALRDKLNPLADGSVNELLIVMAAARHDPTVGEVSADVAARLERAQEKATLARWGLYRDRPLSDYKRGSVQLYTDREGYRARIATGDVPERDENLAEARRKIAELAVQRKVTLQARPDSIDVDS